MNISAIEIDRVLWNDDNQACHGTVLLKSCDHLITLSAHAQLPKSAGQNAIDAALTTEALRQLRRMPEFRSGQATLTIEPNCAPRVLCDIARSALLHKACQ